MRARRPAAAIAAGALLAMLLAACAASGLQPGAHDGHGGPAGHGGHATASAPAGELATAKAATDDFADPDAADAAGYASTLDSLGCFQDPEKGGMGVHYLRSDLMDDALDVSTPESLVYSVDASGSPTRLVALEYIVPVEAWTKDEAPMLLGQMLHRHPSLPLWVLHAWVHEINPAGVFADFNPEAPLCPQGVPVFGVDLP